MRRLKEFRNISSRLKVKEKLYSENQKLEVKKYQERFTAICRIRLFRKVNLKNHISLLYGINIELQQVRLDHSEKSIEIAEKNQLLQDYQN